MINLIIKQSWPEKSSDTALEEFKSVLAEILNSFPSDRHIRDRWSISKISEGNAAQLIYDERAIASLKIEDEALYVESNQDDIPRYDDVMYAVRYAARRLLLAVYSNVHGARLPQDHTLSIDHSSFKRNKTMVDFFSQSQFVPRFAPEGMENFEEGRQALAIYSPYYAENKEDGSIHILNNSMLDFLLHKEDQQASNEFSYRVADSMDDFARKYDFALIPGSFYQNYGLTAKIINNTYFDVYHISRKVFIDPYVWDFDSEHDSRYYKNVRNGLHLMDKIRKGEDLDSAIKRVLMEEFRVADDYVGARIWGIEFDRDKEGVLTPRLKVNIFVHGLSQKQRSRSHDWVSIQ